MKTNNNNNNNPINKQQHHQQQRQHLEVVQNYHRYRQRQQFHILLLVVIGLFCLLSSTKNLNLKSYYPTKLDYGSDGGYGDGIIINRSYNNNDDDDSPTAAVATTTTWDETKKLETDSNTPVRNLNDDQQQQPPSPKPRRKRPPLSESFINQPEFPRWGGNGNGNDDNDNDVNDIDINSIRNFLPKKRNTNLYHFYIFGGSSGVKRQGNNKPQLYVSNLRRRMYYGDWAFKKRLKPTEVLLEDSLQYLIKYYANNNNAEDDESSSTHNKKKWSRLWEVVQPSTSSGSSGGGSVSGGGIPLIVQLGDDRGCNKYNDDDNNMASVPIFTVCVRYHDYNCNHSLPLPAFSLLSLIHDMEKKAKELGKENVIQNDQQSNNSVTTSSRSPSNPNFWDDYFRKQDMNYPWSTKVRQVVWRGTDTGALPFDIRLQDNRPNMKYYGPQRWMMVNEITKQEVSSSNYSNMFDVGFHRILNPGNNKPWQSFVHNETAQYPIVKGIKQDDFQKYIAILDVDGNSWSSRFVELLGMNSVILKVEPESVDYFQPRMIPWKHFVPIKMDSSDIIDVVEYVLDPSNNEEMRQIVINAHNWVKENFTYQKVIVDTLNILEFYVEKLDQYDENRRNSGNDNNNNNNDNNNSSKKKTSSSWIDQFDQMMNDKEFISAEEIIPYKHVGWSRLKLPGYKGIPPSCITTTTATSNNATNGSSKQPLFGCRS